MKVVIIALIALVVIGTTAKALDQGDIAELPNDQVAMIRRHCAEQWADDFQMRLYCENMQYEALKKLLQRDSLLRRQEMKRRWDVMRMNPPETGMRQDGR